MDQSKCVVVANRPKSVSRARAENDPLRSFTGGSHQPSFMNDWFPLRELQCDQGEQAQHRPDIRMQSH